MLRPKGRAGDSGGSGGLGVFPPGGATVELLTVSELLFSEVPSVSCGEGNAVKVTSLGHREPGESRASAAHPPKKEHRRGL